MNYFHFMNQTVMRIFLSIIMLSTFIISEAQTYISLAPSISNQAGTLADKMNLGLEVGRQWDVFSVGMVIAKNSLQKAIGRDTTTFFELRPNLNVFQQGKFTNTFTAGIGYILNAQENLLTELSSGIEYAYFLKSISMFFLDSTITVEGIPTAIRVFLGSPACIIFRPTIQSR
jgi:hypothetical protein